jgi:hypothetical protein
MTAVHFKSANAEQTQDEERKAPTCLETGRG